MADAKIAVQGSGNVGGTVARIFYQKGYKVVALSDVSGGIYCADGLPVDDVLAYIKQHKTLRGYSCEHCVQITNQELLQTDVDILIPAAIENQIVKEIAPNVKAKIIVEGANGPTTVDADEILRKKGAVIVPDILANAGGVIVSYFEWVQNLQAIFWDADAVHSMLEKILLKSFDEVYGIAEEKGETLRIAAYMVALKRLIQAIKMRGIFP